MARKEPQRRPSLSFTSSLMDPVQRVMASMQPDWPAFPVRLSPKEGRKQKNLKTLRGETSCSGILKEVLFNELCGRTVHKLLVVCTCLYPLQVVMHIVLNAYGAFLFVSMATDVTVCDVSETQMTELYILWT